MITLYTFGPAFGLPDATPFVTKAGVLLKLSKLPYRTQSGGMRKAPRGSEPCGADAGVLSMVAGVTCPSFDTESRKHVERHPNLFSYRARHFGSYFPELVTAGSREA
jgi:hypothetical protein